jgi:hypothetical protein
MRVAIMNVCLLTRMRPRPRTRLQKSERFRSSLGGSPVITIDLSLCSPERNCSGAFEQRASRTKGPLSFPGAHRALSMRAYGRGPRDALTCASWAGQWRVLANPKSAFAPGFGGMNVTPSVVPSMSDSWSTDKLNSLSANFIHKNSFLA